MLVLMSAPFKAERFTCLPLPGIVRCWASGCAGLRRVFGFRVGELGCFVFRL